ncbi:Acg family FMN-binding oxidoreductase [Bounagaea algeriensis]
MDGCGVDSRSERGWTSHEASALEHAVEQAPSVHNVRPWWLELQQRRVVLFLRKGLELPRHDPKGRDLIISCGAALLNLFVTARSLGWNAQLHRHQQGDAVATLAGLYRSDPAPEEVRRYEAIGVRRSERRPFAADASSTVSWSSPRPAVAEDQVAFRWIGNEAEAATVARALSYAARVFRGDRGYQRELGMWMNTSTQAPQQGLRLEALGSVGLGAAGLATSRTHLADEERLTEWIRQESVLLVSSRADDRIGWLQVGEAMQELWLQAAADGLAASVTTQALHLPEVRSQLREQLESAAHPFMLMRFGQLD